ncbi:telomerase-binding protein EST1A-like [Portunus trituberculatus]|uniref:telomerase-binding protein EST1A-like n=1 Tax=Portunus trituberculatus TaxID=210409 RepID=UPI001E1CE532|nr:telomerase-binding protein EST1A-like [Portunus trituberculatus]XP_045127560.1 telomerase-binding protein EST1A-like [Portunus trituberculatus]XP_045127561.1 telomerase-binding protein EST1A-like [Portunus trituberculatus]
MSNQTHHEHSEKKSSAEKMRPDNPAGRLFGKSLVIQNEKNAPERKPARREERRRGKPEKQPGTEAAAKPYNTEKHFPERSQHMNKSSAVQQAKLRNNSNNNEFYAWVPEIVEAKSDQKTSPEKPNTKREKSRFGKHSVITETSPQNDQPRGRANEKVAEGEGKPRHTNRDKFEGTKSDNNKGNYEQPYSKKEESRGSKWTQKIQDKADSETLPDIESLKLYDTDSKSVQELAAKVDKLVCSKNMGKSPNFKKGRGWSDYHVETKNYLHADYKKGTLLEDSTSISTSETQEKGKTGNKNEGKVSPVSTAKKENLEKTPRAKSYLSARESRKKRGNSKTPSPGNHLSSQREELKVEVSPNTDSHERVVHLSQKNESNSSEHRKPHQGRGASEPPISKKAEESPPYPQKATVTIKNKSSRYHKPSGSLHGEKFASGKYDSEDDMMLHDAEDDWGREVDHDMIWCNQPDKKSGLQSWEDEKLFCRNRRVKHHSEGEDPCQRVDSPGRRGGLIQLPTTTSREASVPEPAVPRQAATQPTVVQRHLYNPNNPSKPVAVVPSARDLPVTRETQRGSSWGSSGEAASGSSLPQVGQATEYHMEGSSTKVDPSLLYSISKGEMDISYYVSSNQLPVEFRRIMDIRMHLQGCYQQLLVSDIRLCQEKNIEGSLWKTLYYTIIEKLREYINREATLKERSLATLLMLVEEGLRYLQDLLEALQQEYGFTLEDYLEEEGEVRGRVRMALLSAQKLLLSLGDLARYKEQYNASPNYNIAKKWYQMALQVYPRNGRPFNQLAIIAFSQKRPLDVVYYYMRSLTASNPIMSARDALVAMFDDIRKRYVSVQQSEPHPEGTRSSLGRSLSHEGLRQELWIRPDSGVTNCRTLSSSNNEDTTDKDDDLKKIPVEQLMKQFLAGYLHCHGMLFSGVGLDGFRDCCFNMLQEFSVLLRASPPRLSTNHLLQIMAINMYAITNTELKDARVEDSGYRSAAQELALVLAQEMMGQLVRVVVMMMPEHVHHHPPPSSTSPASATTASSSPPDAADAFRLFSPTLAHFMPPLKAWCDWLLYNSPVWNPPPPVARDYSVDGEDMWASVAELATILRGFGTPDVPLTQSTAGSSPPSGDLVPLRLSEDTFLRGYEPLLSAHSSIFFAPSTALMGRAQDWARVSRLQTCLCQFLCGVDPPVLRLQKTEQGDMLVSVVDTSPPPSPAAVKSSFSGSDVEVEESLSESETSECGEEEQDLEGSMEEDGLSSTVKLLKKRKMMLEKKHRRQKRLHSLLEGSVTLEMEVRPRYLVPDTNCFIEHLDVVQDLAGGPYTVMVPLVVLNELDGLSRDAVVAKYRSVGHAVRVREGAATALHYLRTSRPLSIKCVTSQGSVLSSTLFTSEMDLPDATNDDKILSCCVHFCSDSTQRRPIRAGVRRLYREVVLLTEDRNLRVKAHARDVPVRDLLDFARWAGVR